jgi:hypothetical protein
VKGDVHAARELRGWLQAYPPEGEGDIEIADMPSAQRKRLLQRLVFEDETRLSGGLCPTCGKEAAQGEFE